MPQQIASIESLTKQPVFIEKSAETAITAGKLVEIVSKLEEIEGICLSNRG